MSCRASLTSWGEGGSLASVGHPSSDDVTIKIPYQVDVLLHRPAFYPIVSLDAFLAFSDLTCHLEDTGIGVFWFHCAV